MSQEFEAENRASGSDVVDVDWYLDRYPDVRMSGMDAVEHFVWLGRRLGRLPGPPQLANAQMPADRTDGVRTSGPIYNNDAIRAALEKVFAWLFPADMRGLGRAPILSDEIANNFWNDESGGVTKFNALGKMAVDFMSCFDGNREKRSAALPRARRDPKSILLASYYAPSRSHAGGLRILDVYEEIRVRHPEVRLSLFCPSHPEVDGDTSFLSEIFDEIYFCEPHEFGPATLRKAAVISKHFDLVDLQFHQAGLQANGFRQFGRTLIYTPMEVLSRFDFDLVRKSAAQGDFPLGKFFSLIHRGSEERQIMQSVDATVCVSDADADFLMKFAGSSKVTFFPTGLSRSEFNDQLRSSYRPVSWKKRKDRLVFAAYFGSETNVAGLKWYLEEVHPRILKACPTYNLGVVGRGDTKALEALNSPSVSFIGEVPRLSPVLEQCKAGLVLALHGSGFRGKINQYALCGLPSVSTTLGATGLEYINGQDILIGDTPKDFADQCISILTKETTARQLSKAARKRAIETYSWAAIWPRIAAIYGFKS